MAPALNRTRAALIAFVILGVAPFAYAATRSWFWQHEYVLAPVAAGCYLLLVGALVLGRYRWAWVLLALLYSVAIVSWGFDEDRFTARWVLGLTYDAAALALLMSHPIRDRLRRPVNFWPRRKHLSLG